MIKKIAFIVLLLLAMMGLNSILREVKRTPDATEVIQAREDAWTKLAKRNK